MIFFSRNTDWRTVVGLPLDRKFLADVPHANGHKAMGVNRFLNQAREALDNSPFSTIRGLELEVLEDALVITGKVRSFYEKQMAQEAIRAVCRDVELQNTVDVS